MNAYNFQYSILFIGHITYSYINHWIEISIYLYGRKPFWIDFDIVIATRIWCHIKHPFYINKCVSWSDIWFWWKNSRKKNEREISKWHFVKYFIEIMEKEFKKRDVHNWNQLLKHADALDTSSIISFSTLFVYITEKHLMHTNVWRFR